MNDRVILLVGGRLDGTIHEIRGRFLPSRLGLKVGEAENWEDVDHEWYKVHPTETRDGMRVAYHDPEDEA